MLTFHVGFRYMGRGKKENTIVQCKYYVGLRREIKDLAENRFNREGAEEHNCEQELETRKSVPERVLGVGGEERERRLGLFYKEGSHQEVGIWMRSPREIAWNVREPKN